MEVNGLDSLRVLGRHCHMYDNVASSSHLVASEFNAIVECER